MARVRLTQNANSYMRSHGLALQDIIEAISEYEILDEDLLQSGLLRAGKVIQGRRVWVIYRAIGESLVVVHVIAEEVNQ